MPGQLVQDSLAPSLTGALASPLLTTTTGTIVQVEKPGSVRVKVTTGTVSSTGNSATLTIEVQGSDSSTFATGNVSYGRFAALTGTDAAQSSLTRYLQARVYKRYMRAIFTVGGTNPSYGTLTATVREPHDHRVGTDTA